MKYYIIPSAMAEQLSLTEYRHGDQERGYLVHSGDLVNYGLENAERDGATEVSLADARNFVKHLNK